MKSKFSDQDVLRLFTGLKNAENTYPSDMMQSRREKYIRQATTMFVLTKTGQNGASNSAGNGLSRPSTLTGFTPSIGKVLEIILVTALVAEAGMAAYLYRNQIREFIDRLMSPRVEHVANPTDSPLPLVTETSDTVNETNTETPIPTITTTVTVTEATPVPPTASENNNTSGGAGSEQVNPTAPAKDNPGNHYGNTPKPDRPQDTTNKKDNPSPNKSDDKKK